MTDDRGRSADFVDKAHEASLSADRSPRPTTRLAAKHQGYFIDGAEAFAAAAVDRWLDIATAPAGQRVIVGASHLNGDAVGSYWWQADDVIGADGRPVNHPTATQWRRGSV
ncbi:hypothetical protein [Bosea sp. (in: a-proteobacteria)]|jgi:hypothetical protein|uniref:hypothetical protein n=1 Tax=Bosea sp. (in: a-proteobacteria) TaxID=1871050 RepID=UPI002DDD6747|nr:hypothetical protein [Bosea sp. (in: a-proteobacteria)]HEV2508643.1 hypothetical protein [Bosea sp. (in: a-proteobacteria)]